MAGVWLTHGPRSALVKSAVILPKIRCFSAVFQVQVQVQVKVQVKQGSQSSGFWGENPPPAEIRRRRMTGTPELGLFGAFWGFMADF